MCAVDDCEPWTSVRHEQRTAGKEHECVECHRTIRSGERHEYTTGRTLDTPQWLTCWMCAHCSAAGRWLDVMCGGWPIGVLYDELREHWEEGYASPVLGRLAAGVHLGWLDGRMPVPKRAADDARRQLERQVA